MVVVGGGGDDDDDHHQSQAQPARLGQVMLC